MSTYPISNADEDELVRLRLLETWQDPGTIRRLQHLGVGAGWRCLEVGAGAGSITSWLSTAVGDRGSVVAVDLDTRFLEGRTSANVELRRQDVVHDELPVGAFDLVHTRALLMHLDARDDVLEHLVACLRPGGTLLVEEHDAFPLAASPSAVFISVMGLMAQPWTWARSIPERMQALGLEQVTPEVETDLFNGGSLAAHFWRDRVAAARPLFVDPEFRRQRGYADHPLTDEDIDEVLRLLHDPAFWTTFTACVAVSGRAPTKD